MHGGRLLPRACGDSATLAELWNGSAWTALPTPNPGGSHGSILTAVSCRSASACTAVGSYRNGRGAATTLAETWNGTAWRIQPTPGPAGSFGSYLTGVSCTTGTACTAVGYYYTQNFEDGAEAFAESWNGTAWTLQQVPPDGVDPMFLYAVSCTSPAACVAVGSYAGNVNGGLPLAESWNGRRWRVEVTAEPAGATGAGLAGVSCTAASACEAVGGYIGASGPGRALAESGNGATWTLQATVSPGTRSDGLSGVSCTSASACTAVGFADGQGPLAEGWNGSIWSQQPAPRALPLNSVSCTAPAPASPSVAPARSSATTAWTSPWPSTAPER